MVFYFREDRVYTGSILCKLFFIHNLSVFYGGLGFMVPVSQVVAVHPTLLRGY